MTSLYALTNEATLLASQINNTAEALFSDDPADVAAATEALEQLITAETGNRAALTAKADAWCWVIDDLRSKATARREHANRLRDLADQAADRAETLQDQLIAALFRVDPDATRWELADHQLTSRRSTAVELDPEITPEDLPAQFQRVKTTTSVDKTAIKAAITAGATVPGAQLVSRRSWSIK